MLLKDAIQIPSELGSEQFVLRLTDGVSEAQAQKTLDDYVVTPAIARNLDTALGVLQGALGITIGAGGNVTQGPHQRGRAAYLHGSFGSGKSHFMAVLHLLLKGDPRALGRPELHPVVAKYRPWLGAKKLLLVPYHMLGASSIEARVFEHYSELVARLHPGSRSPALFDSDALITDAEHLRKEFGNEAFFRKLGSGSGKGWGKLASAWDEERYTTAIAAQSGTPPRQELASTLLERVFPGTQRRLGTVGFDAGLELISQHAKELGYDGIVFFLDELILWLASKAATPGFLGAEIDKIVNLVEAQRMNRPIPIVSFIARQRDLRELIGRDSTGAQQLVIDDKLSHHEGRFVTIDLSTTDLPEIASKRLLQPSSAAGRQAIDAAIARVEGLMKTAAGAPLREALLGDRGTLDAFRKTYPFSPALVDTLVAASSMLQRDRTALRAMLQLLVEQRDQLAVGEIIPVGDLYDVIRSGSDAITPAFQEKFERAQKFFEQRLVPLLEREHKRSRREVEALAWNDPARKKWRADERILKTVLLSHLVPSVAALQHLTPQRIAALNHGSIETIIPGQEAQEVMRRMRTWSSEVTELQLSGDATNPQIGLALHSVDIEGVLKNALSHDNHGNRVQLLKELVFAELEIESGSIDERFAFTWRGTKRQARVVFRNIREMALNAFENEGPEWLLVVDYPIDEEPAGAGQDDARIAGFRARGKDAQTLLWRPAFFNQRAKDELGRLVRLERILRSDQSFDQAASHLSSEDKRQAKPLLEGQRNALRGKVLGTLMAAYGLSSDPTFQAGLDGAVTVDETFLSLDQNFGPRPPAAGRFKDGLVRLLEQAIESQFPRAPRWERLFGPTDVKRALEIALKAASHHPHRVELDSAQAKLMREFAGPLDLGRCTSAFELGDTWLNHFNGMLARSGDAIATVRSLREWTDEPEDRGLPREVQDLLAIIYAAQSERAFFRAGASLQEAEIRIGGLQPDDELKKIPMPSEATWAVALKRAEAIFGETNPELFCNGPNVASLAARVRSHVRTKRAEAAALRQALIEITPQPLQAPSKRLKDAKAVLDLFEQLDVDSAKDVIERLAGARFDPDVTPESIAASWRQAQAVIDQIHHTKWQLVDGLRTLGTGDARGQAAAELVRRLDAALVDHQLSQPLQAELRDVYDKAVELMVAAPPTREPGKLVTFPPAPPAPQPPIETGVDPGQYVEVRSAQELQELAKRLSGELVREGTILEVTWKKRRDDR